ncbi:MAG: hypothetical protein IJ026_02070 [Candidatus Methanomethylophilaceae archaeon]|nr:hypothetical protein [Candidatus Methanomethylophilaceae archaeon]
MDNEPIASRGLTVFVVVDVSRSMRGNKIRTVNRVMRQIVPELRDIGGCNVRVDLAVMSFSDGCHWMHPSPVPVESFSWADLEPGGWTSLGAACLELDAKMSRNGFLGAPSLSFAPVVILLSDGAPTDRFEEAMYTLNRNRWFRHSIRVAFAIGAKAKVEKLSIFTGDPETVIKTNNMGSLSRLLRLITIRSSEIGSRSSSLSDDGCDGSKREDLIRAIRAAVDPSDLVLDEGW